MRVRAQYQRLNAANAAAVDVEGRGLRRHPSTDSGPGVWSQVCCWVHEDLCLVANVGDAKAVLARRPPVQQQVNEWRTVSKPLPPLLV